MAQLHMTSRASSLSRLSQAQQPCCAVLPSRPGHSNRQSPFVGQAQPSSSRSWAAVQVLRSSKRQRRSVSVQVGVNCSLQPLNRLIEPDHVHSASLMQYDGQQGKGGGILQLLLLLLPAAEHVQLGRVGVWGPRPSHQNFQPSKRDIPVCLHRIQAEAAIRVLSVSKGRRELSWQIPQSIHPTSGF